MTVPMKDLLALVKAHEDACMKLIEGFFSGMDYDKLPSGGISAVSVSQHENIRDLYSGSGFYVILTNYKPRENSCTFKYDGLHAVYRGHCTKLSKRVESHLFKSRYDKNRQGTKFDSCMQVDGGVGINIDLKPYSDFRWVVIQHKMRHSTARMREMMEDGFVDRYGIPAFSLR